MTEPGIGRRDRRVDVAANFGGARQATNQAFTVLVAPDRDDFGDLAITVEDDNRFPARRATNELTGPIAELADLDALHVVIVAKIFGQVKDAALKRLFLNLYPNLGALLFLAEPNDAGFPLGIVSQCTGTLVDERVLLTADPVHVQRYSHDGLDTYRARRPTPVTSVVTFSVPPSAAFCCVIPAFPSAC
jgi:hypothetical protein